MKLTVKDLIAKKAQRVSDVKEIYIKSLGGSLEFEKIPLEEFLDLIDGFNKNKQSTKQAVRMEIETIYECCPMLHSKELQDAYDCKDPLDIVLKVFDDNIEELADVFAEVTSFYGMGMDEAEDEIKNS